ncbi:peptidylprolyl isomerase [Thalassotalea agarivorans]|uniref:Peptidyl-prolyl cis-trans isomerase n=1 Tax=Thalassotalea agarivorans TaxID=349064 RepID=A0A1H9YFG1_THASX|nr:peptidylprolyl isomerase [Thalassotalea agarivorans]SES67665.1 peptidyl-prolyl cis-trans isomerase A (cyclophilin A) [Thalassotalea agarivorans]
MKNIIFIACLVLTAFSASATQKKNLAIDPDNLYPQVKIETSMGTMIVELDRVRAPITVDNFLTYVVQGEYNGTIFHRVEADFVVQGGGFTKDYMVKRDKGNIFNESGNGLKNTFGTIAMARESAPHSANRQFFFNLGDNKSLDPGRRWGYAVFGMIVEGDEVLEKMAQVKTDYNDYVGWENVPIEPIVITKVTLLRAQ